MNLIKYSIFSSLILCLVIGSFAQMPVNALTQNDVVEEEYLIKHGHSDEIVRMMELQKSRLEPEEKKIKKNNRFVKFFKNLFYERDITMPLVDFGQDRVRTVESPEQ